MNTAYSSPAERGTYDPTYVEAAVTFHLHPEAIPGVLKVLPNWLSWRTEERIWKYGCVKAELEALLDRETIPSEEGGAR